MYLNKVLEIKNKIEERKITPEILEVLKENPTERGKWEEEINNLKKEILNSSLRIEDKENFLKSLNEYKKLIPKNSNPFQDYFPYILTFGLGFFLGYSLRGEMNSMQNFLIKNILKGFYGEMGK